jgi:hypothetical protein
VIPQSFHAACGMLFVALLVLQSIWGHEKLTTLRAGGVDDGTMRIYP